MKRYSVAAALATVACLLAGCASGSESTLSANDFYELSGDVPVFKNMSNEELDELGNTICDVIRSDDDGWLRAVKFLTDNDVPARAAGEFIGYAQARHCPDQAGKLPDAG